MRAPKHIESVRHTLAFLPYTTKQLRHRESFAQRAFCLWHGIWVALSINSRLCQWVSERAHTICAPSPSLLVCVLFYRCCDEMAINVLLIDDIGVDGVETSPNEENTYVHKRFNSAVLCLEKASNFVCRSKQRFLIFCCCYSLSLSLCRLAFHLFGRCFLFIFFFGSE